MAKKMVVFLHGFGSNGADLRPLGRIWRATLPDTEFVSPDAPHLADHGMGFQWFSLQGISDESRPLRVAQAREAFDHCLQQLFTLHGFNPNQDKLVLMGFSQGAIMALDALVRGTLPLAGVIACSGRFASPAPWLVRETPILLSHGKQDPVIPWQSSASAYDYLQKEGFNVRIRYDDNLDHGLSQATIMAAQEFIRDCFS